MADAVYEIFPAIGIARVGNAPEAFYIGPEKGCELPIHADGSDRPFTASDFRDREGRLQRQAARFRIWRRLPGAAPEEVTLATAGISEIRWTAHLANKKASWYRFQTIRGQNGYASNHPLRNPEVQSEADRRRLIIDPGPRSIAGRNAAPVEFSRSTIPAGYTGGSFPPATLKPESIETLGSLRTDALGRLLLLGGFGHSGSTREAAALSDYANNDGWFDDVADGPVTATIRLASGETLQAKSAWVIVGPPAYAPQVGNLVTLDDLVFDVAVRFLGARLDIYEHGYWKTGAAGYRPRFKSEIQPILVHIASFPWVTDIPAGPHSFDMAQLGDPGAASADLRKFYFDIMRGPGEENLVDSHVPNISMMPLLLGDDAIAAEHEATLLQATSKYLSVTDTQYFFLQQWAAGHFDPGERPARHPGEALSRAVLENCVGGPLSPGIETTWIARNPAIYAEAYRLRAKSPAPSPLSLGFDPADGLEPGDLTRYMALPWQADFNECATQRIQGRVLWWWPAQRPIAVFLPDEVTGKPGSQVPWIGSNEDPAARGFYCFADHLEMLRSWDKLGFVLDVGQPGTPQFVEVGRKLSRTPVKAK
jgi:L-Lysine epsilon oxidase N-terminal/L-lysine epsilon oxidase C-terminal domain